MADCLREKSEAGLQPTSGQFVQPDGIPDVVQWQLVIAG
jgi:hypothetical protein